MEDQPQQDVAQKLGEQLRAHRWGVRFVEVSWTGEAVPVGIFKLLDWQQHVLVEWHGPSQMIQAEHEEVRRAVVTGLLQQALGQGAILTTETGHSFLKFEVC